MILKLIKRKIFWIAAQTAQEELFNHLEDPDMVQNLASNPDYLVKTNDPRSKGLSPWDNR